MCEFYIFKKECYTLLFIFVIIFIQYNIGTENL